MANALLLSAIVLVLVRAYVQSTTERATLEAARLAAGASADGVTIERFHAGRTAGYRVIARAPMAATLHVMTRALLAFEVGGRDSGRPPRIDVAIDRELVYFGDSAELAQRIAGDEALRERIRPLLRTHPLVIEPWGVMISVVGRRTVSELTALVAEAAFLAERLRTR